MSFIIWPITASYVITFPPCAVFFYYFSLANHLCVEHEDGANKNSDEEVVVDCRLVVTRKLGRNSKMFGYFLLALSLLSSVEAVADNYDHSSGRYYVDFCGAAYCGPKSLNAWDCGACKAHPGVNATAITVRKSNTHAFVGYVPERNQVVVSFAGTEPLSIQNWIDDIDFIKKPYPACDGCKAHSGFYDAYLSVASEIEENVARYTSDHPSASLGITGHSLGAALASHATMDLVGKGYTVDEVFTFGEPRFGNDELRLYMQGLPGAVYRIVHSRDPVPHLIPQDLNFRHTAREVFYTSDTEWKSCDGSGEDTECSDRYVAPLMLPDHLNYLGFDFTKNFVGCKL